MYSYAITPYERASELEQENQFIGRWVRNYRDRRTQRREDRQQARLERIEARGSARATARAAGPGFGDTLLSTIGSIGSSLLGGGGQDPMAENRADQFYEPAPQKNNTMVIVIALVVVLAVVGGIIYMKKKK